MPTKTAPPQSPECTRLHAVHPESQSIGQFMEWLQTEKHLHLCCRHEHTDDCREWRAGAKRLVCDFREGESVPINTSTEKLLAEYFKIDLNKVDDERRALLDYMRKQHENQTKSGAR